MATGFSTLLTIGAVLTFGALSTGTARAQDDSGAALDARQHGYQHGYRDGYERGRASKTGGGSADFHTQDYDRADRGYEPYMGSVDLYKDGFREGYRVGYSDGFGGNRGRFGEVFRESPSYDADRAVNDRIGDTYAEHHWAGRDVANDIGYRDGLAAGAHDATTGHSYRAGEHDAWKHADHGYKSAFGTKDEYKNWYREAYEAGYRDGYGR